MSCGEARSVESFERALTLLQGYYADPLATIDQVLGDDPDCLMAHAFRAGLFLISTRSCGPLMTLPSGTRYRPAS